VTDDDKTNMLSCVRAKAEGCPYVIALINDPTLKDGLDGLEADIITEWAKPAPYGDDRAKAAREGLYVELQMLRRLRVKLASFAGQVRD